MVVMITKIHPIVKSKTNIGELFRKVEFYNKFKPTIKYHTYLNPKNGNYKNWKGLRKGTIIAEVELTIGSLDLIDADSKPKTVGYQDLTTQGDLFNDKKDI